MYKLCRPPNIITIIRVLRLKWAGHVKRMKKSELARRIIEWELERVRSKLVIEG